MTATATRYLHLVRHGEATPDESGLTENGRRQATLLGRRLQGIPFAAIHHGPLPRAKETARLIGDELEGVPLHRSSLAGDYVPHVPHRALDRFTGPVDGEQDRHELVVTHNFLVAWLVRDAMYAPKWRWLGLNHANAALTVIRYAPDRPASVLLTNDMRHLPADLRWTGFPPEQHL
ncbi:histidine phosphatase family protein [Streptomyces sp. ISL-112]|uniref:histidine phosphatase family protein n=1 Tax=unclassified Streptomyces TaxID=2593676 RepID=UPI001BE93B3A|nr:MULTISPECIES: histidine phosphatase family protein [unclassified Streptomyces]MBT2426692.1 histidine phosphatase family protein [Streptomyces sp. ISL-112]MBT2463269.1 histidine phosphatase family protein [Streptomyces sp. ISL-63]